jgi:hypothetical protein
MIYFLTTYINKEAFMKPRVSSIMAILTLLPHSALASSNGLGSVESVFILVFCAYCALILVMQVFELFRTLLSKRHDQRETEPVQLRNDSES